MCNLYSITTNQAAIAALFRVVNRYVGNLAPMPGVFPDYPAPVVRNTDTEHRDDPNRRTSTRRAAAGIARASALHPNEERPQVWLALTIAVQKGLCERGLPDVDFPGNHRTPPGPRSHRQLLL
jgi:hypothetical protein